MPVNPQDVVRKEFREAFRGYNQADVDLFLDEVVDEMTRLVEENQRLKVRVTALQQELARYRPAEAAPKAESSEARWRLRRFLEEQGRPLDEIEQMPRSPTVERIAREVPQGPEEDAPRSRDAAPAPGEGVPRDPERPPRNPRPRDDEPRIERETPDAKPPAEQASERPWDREGKPFWAAE